MSLTVKPPMAPGVAAASPGSPRRVRPALLWAQVALAALALGASGVVRYWQSLKVDQALQSGRRSPFPLADLPLELGTWKGDTEPLDPAIAKATGCSDHAFRTYVDERTGAKLGVIVLYGPAVDVFIHSPDNCYPAQGYTLTDGPNTRVVRSGGAEIPFRTMVFGKGEGGQSEHQEVYYTWGYAGTWTPDVPVMKHTERIPGMFKVHLSRRVSEGEFREENNPCEDLLTHLMPELQRRLKSAQVAAPAPGAGR
jgi:EpsI family protein